MEQRFDVKVEDLRRKSRTLIKHLEDTSKRVNNGISVLRSQSSSSGNLPVSKNPDYWRMRNYSGGVGGTFCPEYIHSEDRNRAKRYLDKHVGGKIVIPSKGHSERKSVERKAVKECYCYAESKKTKVLTKRTIDHSSFPCNYCKNNFNVEIPLSNVENANPLESVLPPLGDETLRRVERITYSPTSEFLRRVQKKFSNQKKKPNGTCSEFSVKSSSRQSVRLTRDSGRDESAVEVRCRGGKNTSGNGKRAEIRSSSDTHANNDIKEPRVVERRSLIIDNEGGRRLERRRVGEPAILSRSSSACINDRSAIRIDDGKNENIPRKPRTSLIKTIRSAECLKDNQQRKERPCNKHNPKRISRTISAHSRCCFDDDFDNFESRRKVHRPKCECEIKKCLDDLCYEKTLQSSRDPKDRMAAAMGDNEDKVRELSKFRNDNYFETHGSTQTLVTSSRSSDSLQQYELNDRLFPELVKKIHRKDLVVTMPPCATKQRKRIHYFPKYIVKQEKNKSNTNYNKKKRRFQRCGLTGHAVDLGILKKPCEVTNSLALRYQKGVMQASK